MVYLLDTDSVIFLIRSLKKKEGSTHYRKARNLLERIKKEQQSGSSVGVSAITKAELEYGAAKSGDPEKERSAVDKILSPFDKHAFDAGECSKYYGHIRADLERQGKPIGSMDLLIAAHALALGAHLISGNTRHFRKIKGLVVENWAVDEAAAVNP